MSEKRNYCNGRKKAESYGGHEFRTVHVYHNCITATFLYKNILNKNHETETGKKNNK